MKRFFGSMSVVLSLATLVAGFAIARPARAADEKGLITALGVEVRAEPQEKAKSRMKLSSHGSPVIAIDHSPDGKWVKIRAQFERGGESANVEGWVEKKQVRAISRYGMAVFRRRGETPFWLCSTPRERCRFTLADL